MSVSEQLIQLNQAIKSIETGAQEYRIKDRSVKKADLAILYKEREKLNQQLIEEQNNSIGGITFVARFDGR